MSAPQAKMVSTTSNGSATVGQGTTLPVKQTGDLSKASDAQRQDFSKATATIETTDNSRNGAPKASQAATTIKDTRPTSGTGGTAHPKPEKPVATGLTKRRLSEVEGNERDVSPSTAESSGSESYVESRAGSVESNVHGLVSSQAQMPKKGGKQPTKKRVKFGNTASTPTRGPVKRRAVVAQPVLRRTGPTFKGKPGEYVSGFGSTCYEIYLGGNDTKFIAHEDTLVKSSTFANLIKKAQTNARQKQILRLEAYNPSTFNQIMSFLYRDKLDLIEQNKGNTNAQLKEMEDLMSLAKTFDLPDLQKMIVSHVKSKKLVSRIPVAKFFDWAFQMYYSEVNHKTGNFTEFFQSVAPGFLKDKIDKQTTTNGRPAMVAVLEAVAHGKGFAVELFKASHTVCSLLGIDDETDIETNLGKAMYQMQQATVKQEAKKNAIVKKEPGVEGNVAGNMTLAQRIANARASRASSDPDEDDRDVNMAA